MGNLARSASSICFCVMITSYRRPWKYNNVPVSTSKRAEAAMMMERFIRRSATEVAPDTLAHEALPNSAATRSTDYSKHTAHAFVLLSTSRSSPQAPVRIHGSGARPGNRYPVLFEAPPTALTQGVANWQLVLTNWCS